MCLDMLKRTLIPADYSEDLLSNVHEGIEPPTANGITIVIQGPYHYYHYGCDGVDDKVRPQGAVWL
jgi:hypothetical protein